MSARPSDRFIPWYIAAFFVAQAGLYAWFMHVAHESYPGVVTEKAYDKGLRYNDTIEKSLRQEQRGWTGALDGAFRDGAAAVVFVLRDREGKPVTGAAATLWFVRPVKAGADFSVVMTETGAGRYTAQAPLPARGLWELRVRAVRGDADYQASRKVAF